MDNRQEHLDNLSEIRTLMERSSSFISLSGLSGISAGIIGLVMAYFMNAKMGLYFKLDSATVLSPEMRSEFIVFTIILSLIALILVFALTILFAARKAKKKNLPPWDSTSRRLAINLFIPLVTGGIFCLLLLYRYFDFLVIPSMLVFYGMALINAGKYTLNEIKWLGISEILAGLAALLFLDNAIIFFAVGFGLLNIVYGTIMYFRHEQ